VAVAEESYNIFISGNHARNPFWKIGEIIPEKRILVAENEKQDSE
jgi:hypothetical protein